MRAIEKLSAVVDVDERYIITMYEEETIETNGKTINVIPLVKWLLKM